MGRDESSGSPRGQLAPCPLLKTLLCVWTGVGVCVCACVCVQSVNVSMRVAVSAFPRVSLCVHVSGCLECVSARGHRHVSRYVYALFVCC